MAQSVELATGYIGLAVSAKGLGAAVAKEFKGVTAVAAKTGKDAGTALAKGVNAKPVTVNLRGLTSLTTAAGKAGREAGSRFAAGFKASASTIRDAAGTGLAGLSKAAGGAALALAGIAGAGLAVGVKTAAGMETARIAFSTMLGSAKEADQFLKQLADFAAKTPFEFPELQRAASSLISAGINAKDVIPIMTNLGNATAGMGTGSEGIQRATVALQQMNAAGKITGEDLNQLRDAGIPVYDLLASATGKSKAKLSELAAAGKLGKRELQQMMDALAGPGAQAGLGRFTGLMDKQSASLSGMWSTLKDTVGQGLAKSIAPAFPLIKQGLGSVSDGLASLFGWVARNKTSLTNLFNAAAAVLSAFGTIASAALGAFVTSATQGQATFKDFANFIQTHQAEIVGAFVAFAGGAIKFGIVLAQVISAVLRGFGGFSDGIGQVVSFIIDRFGEIIHGAAFAFGWIPGIGDKLQGLDGRFKEFADNARGNIHKTGDAARGLADGLDGRVIPALKAAGRSIDEVGKKEIIKAAARDAVAKAAIAVRDLGTKLNGSQLKLKTFADRSKLSAAEQAGLRSRLSAASGALQGQITKMRAAGVGQASLSKAWKTGRDRLYDEFRQMGLSRKEAGRLAAKYAGIKPKVKTKFETPGMKDAQRNVDVLGNKIRDLRGKNLAANIHFSTNANGIVANLNKQFQLVKGGPRMSLAAGGPVQNLSGRGVKGRDTEHALVAVGEHMWTAPEVDAVGGHQNVRKLRSAAKAGTLRDMVRHMAAGGPVLRTIRVRGVTQRVPSFGDIPPAQGRASSRLGTSWTQMFGVRFANQIGKLQSAISKASATISGAASISGPGSGVHRGRYYRPVHGGGPGRIHDQYTGFPAVDIGRATGTPVFAGAAGRVTRSYDIRGFEPRVSRQTGYRSYGRVIEILSRGFSTLYAHLSQRGVSAGQTVKGGQRIGLVGNTGHSYGSHLHFGARGVSPYAFFSGGGYANGTSHATPGIHPVAERGMELVSGRQVKAFRGGESVTPIRSLNGGITINGGVHGLNEEQVAINLEKRARRQRALQPSYA